MKSKNINHPGLWLAFGLAANSLLACGPDFPNNLLDGGNQGVLVAPVTDFHRELDRLHVAPARFSAVVATNGYAGQNIESEQADLLTALKRAGMSDADAQPIAQHQLAERNKLEQFKSALDNWSNSVPAEWDGDAQKYVRGNPTGAAPAFPVFDVVAGLPEEFGDYFDGAIAWSNPLMLDKTACRLSWEQVLALPTDQRHFKSVAAAFMLGKSWADEDPETAAGYFQRVRALAGSGFADATGLAAASLGEEARLTLRRNQFDAAITLYLDQFSTGDQSAGNSLQFAAARALKKGDATAMNQLASDPSAQRVITAYLISECHSRDLDRAEALKKWLATVEDAGIRNTDAAEEFALAAYQSGEWELAQRWIDRAPDSPTAQWLEVKLLLRAGKTDDAAARLATLSHSFPVADTDAVTATNAPVSLVDDLTVPEYSYYPGNREAANQMLGELGVLHLARREYTESLDALLRAGFWMDAAYVAERVLTVDELKGYVDANWSATTNASSFAEDGEQHPHEAIRYLLARRLTRLDRGAEAGDYYPAEWRQPQANLLQALATGHDETPPPAQRFYALASAARITRTNGMELIGTEVEPDWHIYDGDFDYGVTTESRRGGMFPADEEELNRTAQNQVTPEERFHYRAVAAALKAEAAKLGWLAAAQLPDNNDETARILCLSGSWLDPKPAFAYYRAILRRCRHTEIGEETARIGKFPKLDENGHVIRRALNAEDRPVPGKAYVIHAGDTLFQIAALASATGQMVTVANIVAANRNLSPDKIRAGRTIDIPAPVEHADVLTPPTEATINPAVEHRGSQTGEQSTVTSQPYILQSGDSLAQIAEAASTFGGQISVQDILDANPGLDPSQLKVGLRILIPTPGK